MYLLKLDQVSKQINQQTILKNLSLTVENVDQIGIKLSPVAATLLIKLMLGSEKPTSGKMQRKTAKVMADLTADGLYSELTVRHYLTLFSHLAQEGFPEDQLLEEFSLSDLLNSRISKLTIGQKRRISLLRMLLFQPELIIVQSPLSQQSNEEVELYLRAFKVIQQRGIATIVIASYFEELLLFSTTIYRYQANLGLEKTDLQNEVVVDQSVPTDEQPKPIYKVACKSADKTVFFSPEEIDFIESINGVSNIRIGDEYFPATATMTELTDKLSKFGFFRCHRSYLVNLQRVAELISYSKNSYTLILKGPAQIKLPLSRSRVMELQQLLTI